MEEAKWYVIHTYSGYENKVSHSIENMVENHNLQDLILEVKVPMEKVEEHKDNEVKIVERKVFPGYVLVKMVLNDDTHYMIRSIRGVTGFVGTSTDPVPLTDREVKRLGVGNCSFSGGLPGGRHRQHYCRSHVRFLRRGELPECGGKQSHGCGFHVWPGNSGRSGACPGKKGRLSRYRFTETGVIRRTIQCRLLPAQRLEQSAFVGGMKVSLFRRHHD